MSFDYDRGFIFVGDVEIFIRRRRSSDLNKANGDCFKGKNAATLTEISGISFHSFTQDWGELISDLYWEIQSLPGWPLTGSRLAVTE